MSTINLSMGIMFLSQTALRVLGNCACLGYFVLTDFSGRWGKPTDLIVKHLTWANFMVLLFNGIPQTMAAFAMSYFLDDILCKLIFYFHRVARGVSLGSTSLLSVFQVITISPRNSKWGKLKVRTPKVIAFFLGLCWAMQLLINACNPMIVTDILGTKNSTGFRNVVYCAIVDIPSLTRILYSIVFASIDVVCLGIMTWASGSMVLMLTKHKQRVQHTHSSLSPQSSPEARATQSILSLVSSFVFFYMISAILGLCYSFFDVTGRWLVNASVAMSACFPAFCPFLLVSQDTKVSNFCCTCSYESTHGSRIVEEL